MRYFFLITVSMVGLTYQLYAQNMGLSFSYFIPRNGSFSTPISPFSIRGVGIDISKNLAIESGFSLYRMAGLSIAGLPFESKESLTGPNFTIFVPAELVFRVARKKFQLDVKAGGFFFYGFDQSINYGNMDKAIRIYKGWDIATSSLSFENYPGVGYHFGLAISYEITSRFGISLECNYLIGQSQFPLQGSYSGGKLQGGNETVAANFSNSKIDFTGLEFSIGVFLLGR